MTVRPQPPLWHAILVLGILPIVLLPAVLKNLGDRPWFVPFWTTIILFEYLSVFIVFWSLRKSGSGPGDIGLHVGPKTFLALIAALTVLGSLVYAFREHTTLGATIGDYVHLGFTSNRFERAFWVLLSITAGVCEEIVFRGYGLFVLDRKGIPKWITMVISSVCFSLMHGFSGLDGLAQNLYLFTAGIFYCVVYRFTKSLIPGMAIHATYDFGGILFS